MAQRTEASYLPFMGGLAFHGGWVPTCRGVLLCGGLAVLTRGSSSCTISPLAKIRTMLSGARGPCWADLSSDLTKAGKRKKEKPKYNLLEIKKCLLSMGKTAFWELPLVSHAEQALCLIKKKKQNKCKLFARQKSFIS